MSRYIDVNGVKLTPHEIQICKYLTDGDSAKVIAYKMDIAYGTVKIELAKIREKTGVGTSLALAVWWVRNKELERIA